MIEYRYTPLTENLIEYACNLDGSSGQLSAAGFMISVIDWESKNLSEREEDLSICISAFLPENKINMNKFRGLLYESIVSPKSEKQKKYDDAYIKAVIADADFMAEKNGRDRITPKDIFLCIITRTDRVKEKCLWEDMIPK